MSTCFVTAKAGWFSLLCLNVIHGRTVRHCDLIVSCIKKNHKSLIKKKYLKESAEQLYSATCTFNYSMVFSIFFLTLFHTILGYIFSLLKN